MTKNMVTLNQSPSGKGINTHYVQGVRLYEAGLVDQAIIEFERVINLKQIETSEYVAAHLNLGAIYIEAADYEMAEKYLFEALRLSPNYDKVYSTLGVMYSSQGKIEQAKEWLLIANKLKPDNPQTHYNLGHTYFELKMYKEAEASLEFVLNSLLESAPSIFILLAEVYMQNGKLNAAHLILQRAVKNFPNDVNILKILTQLSIDDGDYLSAQNYATRLIKQYNKETITEPLEIEQHIQAVFLLGYAYLCTCDFDKIKSSYFKLLKTYPANINLINDIGKSFKDLGELEIAEEVLKNGLANLVDYSDDLIANKQKATIISNLWKVYVSQSQGDLIKAEKKFLKLAEAYPQFFETLPDNIKNNNADYLLNPEYSYEVSGIYFLTHEAKFTEGFRYIE